MGEKTREKSIKTNRPEAIAWRAEKTTELKEKK